MVIGSPITVRVKYSSSELDSIRNELKQFNIFSYPKEYNPTTNSKMTVHVVPSSEYYFTIQMEDSIKVIHWNDNHDPQLEKAKSLRNVFRMIINMMKSKDKVKKLPHPSAGYG